MCQIEEKREYEKQPGKQLKIPKEKTEKSTCQNREIVVYY